jgi:hypothetical protein
MEEDELLKGAKKRRHKRGAVVSASLTKPSGDPSFHLQYVH